MVVHGESIDLGTADGWYALEDNEIVGLITYQLVDKAIEVAESSGYEFMQVKTVKMGVYEDYDITNRFYISCGFKELEVFPLYWDEANPCQIYVMSLINNK